MEHIGADGGHARWRIDGRELRAGFEGASGYGRAALSDSDFRRTSWNAKQGREVG